MRQRHLPALVAVASCLALGSASVATAAPRGDTGRPDDRAAFEVGSYNVYLGADLNPLFGAASYLDLVRRAGSVYAAMEATDFPERAEALADLIAKERVDVLGLQEVALWETAPGDLATSPTMPTAPFSVSYDFLDILLDELAERGVPYEAVASNANFTGTLPIATDTWARFTDRDVILVRADVPSKHLSVDETSVEEENFAAALTIPSGVPGIPPFQVPRGWSSVDVTVKGFTFRFFNTHLEAFGGDVVRNVQAAELAAEIEESPYPAVVVGDINSRPPGCSTNTVAFQTLLDTGLEEVWPLVHEKDPCGGWTSGQDADLLNEISTLDHRIDTIFLDPDALTALQAEVIGDEQRDRSEPSGFWPSDHAGSIAKLRTVRP